MLTFLPSLSSTSQTFLLSHSKQQQILFIPSFVIFPTTLNPYISSFYFYFYFSFSFSFSYFDFVFSFLCDFLSEIVSMLLSLFPAFLLLCLRFNVSWLAVSSHISSSSEESRFIPSFSVIFFSFLPLAWSCFLKLLSLNCLAFSVALWSLFPIFLFLFFVFSYVSLSS